MDHCNFLRSSHEFLLTKPREICLFHLSDDLPFLNRTPVPLSACDANIGLFSFARPIDHASHNGDGEGLGDLLNLFFNPFHQAGEVHLATTTGGTGDDLDAALPDLQGPQYLKTDPNLFNRIAGQGNPQGISDPLIQKKPYADRGFDNRPRTPMPASVTPR